MGITVLMGFYNTFLAAVRTPSMQNIEKIATHDHCSCVVGGETENDSFLSGNASATNLILLQ